MGTGDRAYVYGDNNGSTYRPIEGDDTSGKLTVHWDPRVEVSTPGGHLVQVGVVPPSDRSTNDGGIWDSENGQYLTLTRDGINRLIVALREARVRVYGVDE